MKSFLFDDTAPFGHYAARGLVRLILERTRALPRHWLGQRVGFMLRRLAIFLLRGRPVDTQSLGASFRLYPDDNICERRILFAPHDFDEAEREILLACLPADGIFLDVGANIGGYALAVAAHLGSKARILAIEPQPEIFHRLLFNLRANAFATLTPLEVALVDQDGEVTLFLDPHNKGEASVKIVSAEEDRQVRVAGRGLVSLLADQGITRMDALKLDIEGAEDLTLRPFFQNAAPSLWPRVIILARGEERWSGDLLAELAAHGYRCILDTRNNHVLERAP